MFKTLILFLALMMAPAAMAAPEFDTPTESECQTMQPFKDTTIEACAHAGYEVTRAKAAALGDTSQPQWYALSKFSRELRRNAVREALSKHGPGDLWAQVVRSMAYELEPAQFGHARLLKKEDFDPVATPVFDALSASVATASHGSVGYEAYAQSTGGKTFDGRDMPRWEALPERIQKAWTDAALAIRGAA